jgi:hypothetical protein
MWESAGRRSVTHLQMDERGISRMMRMRLVLVLTIVLSPQLMAQNTPPDSASRTGQIQAERIAKKANLGPEQPTKVEHYFTAVQEVIRRSPIRIGVAGLGPGAGLTLSSELKWNSSKDQVRYSLWGAASVHRFYTVGTGVEFPHVADRNVALGVEGSHSDAPQLEYYGSGPDSSIHNRTNYRREDTFFAVNANFRPHPYVSLTCGGGELLINVGPGTNHSLASTESVFGPDEAPGVDVQSNYLLGGCGAEVDLRDFPGDPHSGTYAFAGYRRYFAQDIGRFSFHRLDAAAEHYFPFLNQKRVVAIRAKTELSFHSDDQVVPFYMQPTLGSDTDLRGFRRFRFHDENAFAVTAEYRWEVSTGFDMALFFDAGKVFDRPSEIDFTGMESSAGFGLRFKNARSTALRLDTGFSREGVQVWLSFGKLF